MDGYGGQGSLRGGKKRTASWVVCVEKRAGEDCLEKRKLVEGRGKMGVVEVLYPGVRRVKVKVKENVVAVESAVYCE